MSKVRELRVYAFTKTIPAPRGYVGFEEIYIQQLQERTFMGWKTIDEEEIPLRVRISMGCFGDTGGWVSKFSPLGNFERDGIIQPV